MFQQQNLFLFPQGTDITEAFEVHHLNYAKAGHLLQDYRVRDAKLPRNFKFTFKETGFYSVLRQRVADKLKHIDTNKAEFMSKVCFSSMKLITRIEIEFTICCYFYYFPNRFS